jgi:hypothetical protein
VLACTNLKEAIKHECQARGTTSHATIITHAQPASKLICEQYGQNNSNKNAPTKNECKVLLDLENGLARTEELIASQLT